jgi:hypothetical protein
MNIQVEYGETGNTLQHFDGKTSQQSLQNAIQWKDNIKFKFWEPGPEDMKNYSGLCPKANLALIVLSI